MTTSQLFLDLALASGCMVVTDVIATIMVQAEAAYRRHLSAAMDTLGWMVSITTTVYSLRLLDSHSLLAHLLCYAGVGAANYYGTWLGVGLGAKLMHRRPGKCGPLSRALVARAGRFEAGTKP